MRSRLDRRQPPPYRHAVGSWYTRILESVSDLGGVASLPEIYAWMTEHGRLRPRDLVLSSNGRPRYIYIVRTYIRELVEIGELERIRRGVYSLPK